MQLKRLTFVLVFVVFLLSFANNVPTKSVSRELQVSLVQRNVVLATSSVDEEIQEEIIVEEVVETIEETVVEEQIKPEEKPVVIAENKPVEKPINKEVQPTQVVKEEVKPTEPVKKEEPVVVVEEKSAPAVKPNQLIFAGTSSTYQYAGQYNPTGVQNIIDSGIVSSSVTNFNPNDSQTTYFSGHNPGIMATYYRNLQVGSIVSVSDASGNISQYKMIEVVKTDTSGQVMFNTLGISAAQLYYMGSGQESIAIQYCVNGNTDMRVWYGIKL